MDKIINIKENPFAKFSAEEEEDLKSIFVEPCYYETLMSNAIQGNSRILVGQRGLGKSATIRMLFENFKNKGVLPILITRYEHIPLQENKNHFLYVILQSILKEVAKHLWKNNRDLKLLNKEQKKYLYYLVELFYDDELGESYLNETKYIRKKKIFNHIKSFFNKNVRLINSLLDGTIAVSSTLICKSMGLQDGNFNISGLNYFSSFSLEELRSLSMDEIVKKGDVKLTRMLDVLIEITTLLQYKTIVILFDQIDEYSKIALDINKVADFIYPILSDTNLLYRKNLAIIFSLWSEIKQLLNNKGIRFDKFQDIDISWKDEDLVQIINKRLKYYSSNQNDLITFETLVSFDNDRKTILSLVDGSPRSLISLMGHLYNEEKSNPNSLISCFSSNAISKGLIDFCKRFDYVSLQPFEKSDTKTNYYDWIKKILQVKKPSFTINEYCSIFSIKQATALKHINTMKNYKIIRNIQNRPELDDLYEVIDPRIKYLMSKGITELN